MEAKFPPYTANVTPRETMEYVESAPEWRDGRWRYPGSHLGPSPQPPPPAGQAMPVETVEDIADMASEHFRKAFSGVGTPHTERDISHLPDAEKEYVHKLREQRSHDPVNKPAHYQRGGIETIDYIRATLGDEGFIAYAIGNSLKYLSRFRDKDGVQDLKKARVYLDWAIESMEKTP